MKIYTIQHMDVKDSPEMTKEEHMMEWTDVPSLVELNYTKGMNIPFEEFLKREKPFIRFTENFIDYFGVENLYYVDNVPDLDYAKVLRAELTRDRFPEAMVREMVHTAHTLAMTGMEEVIPKAFMLDPDDYKEKLFARSKEEALSTMRLNLRSLLWTELKDDKTGASLDTGNSGLYYDLLLPDEIDLAPFFKGAEDLKITDVNTYDPDENW